MGNREEEISKLKRTEAKLKRTEEFAREIVDASLDCVIVLDLNGMIEYMSPSCLKAVGLEASGEQAGCLWVDLWNGEDRPRVLAATNSARSGEAACFIAEMTTQRGDQIWWDVRIRPARDSENRVDRLIVIARDITELRAVQHAAIEAEKQATAGRMAAVIAHEINNPLEAVTNFIYLAQTTEGLPEDARQHLSVADRELARAAQITRQTLGFYRGGSSRNSFSVSDLISDVLTIFQRRLQNRQISTSVKVGPGLQIIGKDGELRQALLNLTANALDACRTGGKLWIRARKATNWKTGAQEGLRITLADNGGGIAPEAQERVFVPFFTTKADNGNGIGLWVTKSLIERQGGFIRFRSRNVAPSGTVMSIYLPSNQPSVERAQVA